MLLYHLFEGKCSPFSQEKQEKEKISPRDGRIKMTDLEQKKAVHQGRKSPIHGIQSLVERMRATPRTREVALNIT